MMKTTDSCVEVLISESLCEKLCEELLRNFFIFDIIYFTLRDVAQLVARLLWEQNVAGSNPVIPKF